jgi:hypothetical protein
MAKVSIQCLILENCEKLSGIYCKNRDFEECDFFKSLVHDAKKTLLTKAELKKGIIILYCRTCNCIRKFDPIPDLSRSFQCQTCNKSIIFPKKA